MFPRVFRVPSRLVPFPSFQPLSTVLVFPPLTSFIASLSQRVSLIGIGPSVDARSDLSASVVKLSRPFLSLALRSAFFRPVRLVPLVSSEYSLLNCSFYLSFVFFLSLFLYRVVVYLNGFLFFFFLLSVLSRTLDLRYAYQAGLFAFIIRTLRKE